MKTWFILLLIAVIFASGCSRTSGTVHHLPASPTVENLRAFSKLYGYVRYFHPSDEAAAVDWEKFICYGIEQVLLTKDSVALKQTLQDLFLPIAPTINIYFVQNPPPPLEKTPAGLGRALVTWQHRGIGFGGQNSTYRSVRLGRTGLTNPENHKKFGAPGAGDPGRTDPGALFEKHAAMDEVITKDLGNGIKCRIPIALYLPEKTPLVFSTAFNLLKTKLDSIQPGAATAAQARTRIGAVIQSWNIFRHFYPYFDVIQANWDDVLTLALTDVLVNSDEADCLRTLRQMTAALQDGHASVSHPDFGNLKALPALFDFIDNKLVVVATTSDQLQKGDILVEMDGEPANQRFNDRVMLASGSPQWKKARALRSFTAQDSNKVSTIVIDRRGALKTISIGRTLPRPKYDRPENITKLTDDICYINLDQARMEDIDAKMVEIAACKGVIFDLRGYPNSNDEIIRHLIDSPVESARWNIPQIIYPDMENVTGYDTGGRWNIYPLAPRITGKIVFLTNEQAISYAESVMGIIENYHLATIIGSTTAGANGNVNPFTTIGGFRFSWTGMKVLKHDYSQHHLVGIKPGIMVQPTVKGVQEGKDEVLDKALEFLSR